MNWQGWFGWLICLWKGHAWLQTTWGGLWCERCGKASDVWREARPFGSQAQRGFRR